MMKHDDDCSKPKQDCEFLTFRVEDGTRPCRLDQFLSGELEGRVSREKLKKAILAGEVTVGGQVCDSPKRRVEAGDEIGVRLPVRAAAAGPEDAPIKVLYRDASLAVLDKPDGLTVHPCPSCPEGTLVNRLVAHFPELAGQEGDRPGIVHRLDKGTTGLIVAALNEESRLKLSAAFAGREVKKEYLALVYGVPAKAEGSVNLPIGRHPTYKTKMAVLPKGGREALSDYRTLYADPDGRFALVAVRIHTGRTHQIRVHLSHLGHSIVGDALYFNPTVLRASAFEGRAGAEEFLKGAASRPLLHAWKIAFSHPQSEEDMSFCCPPPDDFYAGAAYLARRVLRAVLTGNPGCGKSSVLRRLKEAGIPVWSADAAVAELYAPGADGSAMLKARYGDRFLLRDEFGGVDKKALFKAMYDDEKLRREVEQIIHPIVFHRLSEFWRELNGPPPLAGCAVAEVPLYFETGAEPHKSEPSAPLAVTVYCPHEIRFRRLEEYRGWSAEMIHKMESWQWPEDKKAAAADLIVDNSGSEAELETAAEGLVREIEARLEAGRDELIALLRRLTGCGATSAPS